LYISRFDSLQSLFTISSINRVEGTYLWGRTEGDSVIGLAVRRAGEKRGSIIISIGVCFGAVRFEIGVECYARRRTGCRSVV
jgi:hypothetical protein